MTQIMRRKCYRHCLKTETCEKTMGNSALKLVRPHYTWDGVVEMTEDAYFECLEHYPADNSAN
jgi:hypothetical protein